MVLGFFALQETVVKNKLIYLQTFYRIQFLYKNMIWMTHTHTHTHTHPCAWQDGWRRNTTAGECSQYSTEMSGNLQKDLKRDRVDLVSTLRNRLVNLKNTVEHMGKINLLESEVKKVKAELNWKYQWHRSSQRLSLATEKQNHTCTGSSL